MGHVARAATPARSSTSRATIPLLPFCGSPAASAIYCRVGDACVRQLPGRARRSGGQWIMMGCVPAFMTPALLPSCANPTSVAAVHIASQEGQEIRRSADHDGLRPAFMTPALLPSCANPTSVAAVHIASQEGQKIRRSADHDGLRPAFVTPALLPSCANRHQRCGGPHSLTGGPGDQEGSGSSWAAPCFRDSCSPALLCQPPPALRRST